LNIEASLIEAFILCVEHRLESYDWALDDLQVLCENDPARGYRCIVKIAQAGTPGVASRLGIGFLKDLIEKSGDKIVGALLEDAQTAEALRYALSSAMAFGVYSGSSALDEQLAEFWERWNLREYYLKLCEISRDDLVETARGFEARLGDLILRFRQDHSSPKQIFDFEALDITPAGKVRIVGAIDYKEIVQWRRDLREIYQNVQGTCGVKIGSGNHLVIVIDIQELGLMLVRVNYWVNDCLLPQKLEIELAQTFLPPFLEQLEQILV
jgi:hypothetical protein